MAPSEYDPEAVSVHFEGDGRARVAHRWARRLETVRASTETGQFTSGLRRKSSTFRWTHKGYTYRVQIQVTAPPTREESENG